MNAELKKRREERIREIFRNPNRPSVWTGTDNEQTARTWQAWREPPTKRQLYKKVLICVILYGLVWGVYHANHPAAERVRPLVHRALTEPFDFAAAERFFYRYFGELPALLPALNRSDAVSADASLTAPVHGTVIQPYSETRQGIWLLTEPDQPVTTVGTGWVESVSEHPATGLTVVIRHANGLASVYGWLAQARVERSEWVDSGAVIGFVKQDAGMEAGKLYFALKRGQAFVDPGDVIAFD